MRLFLALYALVLTFFATGQNQNNNWVFADGYSLAFNGGSVTAGTSAAETLNDRRASAYSDASGNLLFYVDHQTLFYADGTPMPDGGFSQFSFENVFIPKPGNTNQVYLVRSKLNGGLDYTLIDLAANSGLGAIVEGEKEVGFFAVGGRLMVATKPDGSGFWLISADNNSGSNTCFIRTFDVNATEIAFNSLGSATWTWVGWYDELDDATLSPDCSLIAVSFKGHYIGLFNYDNEVGEVTGNWSSSIDNTSGLSARTRLAFSPSSEYLYTTGDNYTLTQFEINQNSTLTQGTLFNVTQCTFFSDCVSDIKLGPDGMIYVLNNENQRIDRVVNPDAAGAACNFVTNVAPYSGGEDMFFPRTPNFTCGALLNVSPEVTDVCLGDETSFSLFSNQAPDAVFWDFGDPNSLNDEDTSTEINPGYTYSEPGSYTVTVDATFGDETQSFEIIANVFAFPDLSLEDEYVLCAGDVLVLEPGEALSYQWNQGATTSTFDVTTGGVYSVTGSNGPCAVEVITTVIEITSPTVNLGPDLFLCDDLPVTLDNVQPVLWSDGTNGTELEVTESGTFFATASNECFVVSDTVNVLYVVAPQLGLPTETRVCEGDTVVLNATVPNANVVWLTPTGSTNNPVIEVVETGDYTVTIDLFGCIFTDDVAVEIIPYIDPSKVVMPNIFSPNRDGTNDVYRPHYLLNPDLNLCNVPVFYANLRIFNRWGGQIVDGACSWNGKTENGDELSEGMYFYIVDYSARCLNAGGERNLTGTIKLVR
ncbi:MAG: gliding motility-associated C-terminal domain-containing protein [Flavobacteriales bacterium]